MASGDDSKRKCFTFIWKLENASYCWQSFSECIESPSFTVDEINETNWKLELFPSIQRNNEIGFFLWRQTDSKYSENVKIDCDLSFLSSDGAVLQAIETKNAEIGRKQFFGNRNFASRNVVFLTRRADFLPQDTLTGRCRIWKSVGEMSKDVQCFARSRIDIEKRSILWDIENFSTLKPHTNRTYDIKSRDNDKNFVSVELYLTGGLICDETVRFKIIPDYRNIKMSTFQLSIVDISKNAVKCFQDEFWICDPYDSKDFTLFRTKSELMEKKSVHLPNDVLSLYCECVFSLGTVQEEINEIDFNCIAVFKKKPDNEILGKENKLPDPCCILIDNLKSMMNDSSLSDVKLRTKRQTYATHTFILGARSPVFKAMFSNEMKEKINECVDIEDLSDDTVLHMLHYIYSGEVEKLEWRSAIELYMAADKYQILSLKDICSFHLKSNLCVKNACEALVLADLHQDEDTKSFVQNFILRHGKDIIYSEQWEQLMETNLNLAAKTMRLKFKE